MMSARATETIEQHICFIGSSDFIRRFTARLRRELIDDGSPRFPGICSAIPTEARTVVLEERPDILVVDIGVNTTLRDVAWMRAFLRQMRERFGSALYIIASVSSPAKLALAGSLLFADDVSLDPSLSIDNLIISPPPSMPSIVPIENQLLDVLEFAAGELERRTAGHPDLPALWAPGWVPVMSDPESRNIWMRWLPRYALYINENPIIVGPTGSGKTRLAQAIHNLSLRPGPFVSITPRDFSSNELVQAELFGSIAGAYT
ncbi:MAG: sigma 54-interacting transcriptional regulator, partial [Bdellovibrionales bacterium]|nr:sigma 54-interacting transcriptional regulator [Bdellovibrionales bacterium]